MKLFGSRMRSAIFLCVSVVLVISCTDLFLDGDKPDEVGNGNVRAVDARSCYEFVDFIGVNTHFGMKSSKYYEKFDMVRNSLHALGVKHIRDGNYLNTDTIVERTRKVCADGGIKLLYNINHVSPEDFMNNVNILKDVLWGVEGFNEVDRHINGKDSVPEAWVESIIDYQKKICDSIRNSKNELINSLPILGASFADFDSPGVFADNGGDFSNLTTHANIHLYPSCAEHPMENWGDGKKEHEIKNVISKAYRKESKDLRFIMTESGYHTLADKRDGHSGISAKAAGIYSLHLLFEHFIGGIERSYLYEFIDQWDNREGDIQQHFGMMYSDGTPKPAYTALQNLIALLEDDTNCGGGSLAYEIKHDTLPERAHWNNAGNKVQEKVKHTLLQKSDGSWWVVIYRSAVVYEFTKNENKECKDLEITPVNVTLILNDNARKIDIYRPNTSQSSDKTVKDTNEITFGLDERLVLIRIEGVEN